jgi:hypothetical protein
LQDAPTLLVDCQGSIYLLDGLNASLHLVLDG